MLFGVILGLSGFFKTREVGSAVIDDFSFRLHYGFTSGILFLSTALLGLQELVGKNIDCFTHGHAMHAAINQYCWVTGTFATPSNARQVFLDKDECFKYGDKWLTTNGKDCSISHSYYQWVPYILMLQGILFYLPKLYWTKQEEGKVSAVSDGLRAGMTLKRSERQGRLEQVASNVVNYINLKQAGHFSYGMSYLLAQIWCCLNIVLVVWFNHNFLNGRFLMLGYEWILAHLAPDLDGNQYLEQVFPRMTQCYFETFGYGGRKNSAYYQCILAPNILSEKIFTFLWFWYALLAIMSVVNLILTLLMASTNIQLRKLYLIQASWIKKLDSDICKHENFIRRIKEMNFGQFLFVYFMGRNVNYTAFKAILNSLNESVAGRCPSRTEEQTVCLGSAPPICMTTLPLPGTPSRSKTPEEPQEDENQPFLSSDEIKAESRFS